MQHHICCLLVTTEELLKEEQGVTASGYGVLVGGVD